MSEGSSTDLMLALTYRLGFTLPEMVKRMRMRERGRGSIRVIKSPLELNWIFELIGTLGFGQGQGCFGTNLENKLTTYLKERKN